VYHKRDETIRGHVFCSFLALLLKQELESRIKQADLEWEWKEVIRGLDALQQVEANFQGRRSLFRSQLTAHASQAVRATGVAIPPTLQELQ
jgi:transposase